MPMIDFAAVRQQVDILRVLTLTGRRWPRAMGRQSYGLCPLGCSSHPRVCSYELGRNVFHCHKCHHKGDVIDLYALITSKDVHSAAMELCQKLGIDVPWIVPAAHRSPGPPHWTEGRDE